MKIRYFLSLVLLSSYALGSEGESASYKYKIICDEPAVGNHFIEVIHEDGETGCTAQLEELKEPFSITFFPYPRCVLTTYNSLQKVIIPLEVPAENVTFILKCTPASTSPKEGRLYAYAKSSDMITLAEVFSHLEKNKVGTESSQSLLHHRLNKAMRAIDIFFNKSKNLEKCSFSKLEKFQPTNTDTQFLGIVGTWLVFFPQEPSN